MNALARRLGVIFVLASAIAVCIVASCNQPTVGSYRPNPSGTGYAHVTNGLWDTPAAKIPLGDTTKVSGAIDLSTQTTGLLDAGSGGAGWIQALDFDFNAQTSQTIATDGTYTIGGYTWTKGNSTGDATAMAITAGQGLVITPTAATDLNGGTQTMPFLKMTLSQVIPSIYAGMGIRARVYTTDNATANYDGVKWGVAADLANGYYAARGFTVAGAGVSSFQQLSSSNGGFSDRAFALGVANEVGMLLIPAFGEQAMTHLYGQFSAGFPAMSAMTISRSYVFGYSNNFTAYDLIVNATPCMLFGANRAGSGTAYVAKYHRFVLEYRP